MKCNSCNTLMLEDRSETGARATTTWHRCPCCKQVRLTSELDMPTQVYAQQHSSASSPTLKKRSSKPARRVPA